MAPFINPPTSRAVVGERRFNARGAGARGAAVLLLAAVLLGAGGGIARGVVGGKTVPIAAAPWTALILTSTQSAGSSAHAFCTGVILAPGYVLTAAHCVMVGNSARILPVSAIGVGAGASNFRYRSTSDDPQYSPVSAVRVIPGYIASSKVTSRNAATGAAHDLAILTLARPFDLKGGDARAVSLPTDSTTKPSGASPLVIAGFGDEKPNDPEPDGNLHEVLNPEVLTGCTTTRVLCVYSRTNTCLGDSGTGAVEPGRVPVVVGILSLGLHACYPGYDYFAYLTAPTILRFIKANT